MQVMALLSTFERLLYNCAGDPKTKGQKLLEKSRLFESVGDL